MLKLLCIKPFEKYVYSSAEICTLYMKARYTIASAKQCQNSIKEFPTLFLTHLSDPRFDSAEAKSHPVMREPRNTSRRAIIPQTIAMANSNAALGRAHKSDSFLCFCTCGGLAPSTFNLHKTSVMYSDLWR